MGLAKAEDITPDTTPHIRLIKRVSSVKRNKKRKGLLIRGTEKRVSEKRVLSYQRKGTMVKEMTVEMNYKAYKNKETQIFLGSKGVLKQKICKTDYFKIFLKYTGIIPIILYNCQYSI